MSYVHLLTLDKTHLILQQQVKIKSIQTGWTKQTRHKAR